MTVIFIYLHARDEFLEKVSTYIRNNYNKGFRKNIT